MEQSKNDVMNKANGLTQDFKNKIQTTEKQFERMSQDAGEKVGAIASDISGRATRYVSASQDYVKENPLKGAAIAAATGLVLGSLLTMVFSRRRD